MAAVVPVLLGIVLFGFSKYEPGTPPNSLTAGTQPQFGCSRDEAYVTDGFSSTVGACQQVETMPPGAGRDTAVQMVFVCRPGGAVVTVLDSANAEGKCRR